MGLLRNLVADLWGDAAPEGGVGDSGSAAIHEDAYAVAADGGVHTATSPHHHSHAAFLGTVGGSSSNSAGAALDNNAGFGVRRSAAPLSRTSFRVIFHGPRLGPVRTQLVYQSPEIYSTNISKYEKERMGKKFNAKFKGDMGVGPLDHPTMDFNSRHHKVHVHGVDRTTGDVFWDASYKIAITPFGSKSLGWMAIPYGGTLPIFKKFWIPEEDPGPHLFDVTISTRDGISGDAREAPWGPSEGFDNRWGHSAHIGVEAYRLPILQDSDIRFPGTTKATRNPFPGQKVEQLCDDATCGDTDIHDDTTERLLNQEEDPFIVQPGSLKGWPDDDNRNYYGWMIDKKGIEKDDYDYLFSPKEPPLVMPNWRNYSPVANRFKGNRAFIT